MSIPECVGHNAALSAFRHRVRVRIGPRDFRIGRGFAEGRVTNFASHVYFASELELLFLSAGFEIAHQYGDYRFVPCDRTRRSERSFRIDQTSDLFQSVLASARPDR